MTPHRTALECLDLTQPCRSIFDRKKDLAVNTLRRVVRGLVKFTIERADPCIVQVDHGTASAYLYTNVISQQAGQRCDSPLGVITSVHNKFNLITQSLIEVHHGFWSSLGVLDWMGVRRFLRMAEFQTVAPYLFEHANATWNHGSRSIVAPMPTLTATPKGGSWNVVAPLIVPFTAAVDVGLFAAQGFNLRQLDVRQPAKLPPTVRAAFGRALHQGFANSGSFRIFGRVDVGEAHTGHSIVAPLAVKFYKSGIVKPVDEPLDSITSRDRFGYAAAHLTKLRGSGGWSSLADPIDTICAGATTFGLTTAWIVKHYGGPREVLGCRVNDPLGTITAVDHHAFASASVFKFNGDFYGNVLGGSGCIHRRLGDRECIRWWADPTERPIDASGMPVYRGGILQALEWGTCASAADRTLYTPRELIGPSDNPAINRGFWRVYDLLRRFLGDAAPLPIVRRVERNEWGIERVVEYLIYDIGMRMLTPRELLNAQFSPELAKDYILTGTRESQVAKIGNSVPPLLGAAVVRANLDEPEEFEVAA